MQYADAINIKVLWPALGLKGKRRRQLLELRDGEGCWDRAVTSTEGHGQPKAGPWGISPFFIPLFSHRSASLGTEQDEEKRVVYQSSKWNISIGFPCRSLVISSLVLQLDSEHNLKTFYPFIILLLYYHMYLLIHWNFKMESFIGRSGLPVLTWAISPHQNFSICNALRNSQLLMLIQTQEVWGGTWESSFLTRSQVISMQLVHGPHFEEPGTAWFENGLQINYQLPQIG